MRTAQRFTRRNAATARVPVTASATLRPRLALHEHRLEHVGAALVGPPAGQDAASWGSRRLAALRAIAERCGASAAEQHLRTPTNVARNYYDGGRDFDVWHTLELTFGSGDAAARFFAQARPSLGSWLARRTHTAELQLGPIEIVLSGERDLDLAPVHLEHGAAAQSLAARRRAGDN